MSDQARPAQSPPPLPPRKSSPAPTSSPLASAQAGPSESEAEVGHVGLLEVRTPPPLPPRSMLSAVRPLPPTDKSASASLQTREEVPEVPEKPVLKTIPANAVAVEVTPSTPIATKQEGQHGPAPIQPSSTAAPTDQTPRIVAAQQNEVLLSPPAAEVANPVTSEKQPPPSPPPSAPAPPASSLLSAPALPPRRSSNRAAAEIFPDTIPLPSFSRSPTRYALVSLTLVVFAYFRLAPLWLLLAVLALLAIYARRNDEARSDELETPGLTGHAREEAVAWVNHALYALFPLISTDLLTPFIDLMEDALLQQVPPIVTSVRLTSPALGSQPLLLTYLRPMSDQEWFASISAGSPSNPNYPRKGKGHRRAKSSTSKLPEGAAATPTPKKGHSRSVSAGSTPATAMTPSPSGMSRSSSKEGNGGGTVDPFAVVQETERRRKRDMIVRALSRRRRNGQGAVDVDVDALIESSENDQAGDGRGGAADHPIDGRGEDQDENAGQYVNYQVGFEYKRTELAKRRGWGLHVLAYFGIGVRGLGHSEIPVYIDVLSIKGTVNLRLLLSATPPFAKTATFSFTRLPDFDISAKPLARAAFNAMELPGMKSYGKSVHLAFQIQASIAEVASAFVRPESYTLDIDRLLLGREASLRTASIGVLHIVIHGAVNLPKTDTMGSTDPYVAISLSKFHRPLFSTRTVIDDQNPSWEEPAFILVASEAIERGEHLRLRVCDSDRYTADDAIGIVELDLAELADEASRSSQLIRRSDELEADHPGMRVQGTLHWSVRFCPLWQMSDEEMKKRVKEMRSVRRGEPSELEIEKGMPGWLRWVQGIVERPPEWEEERKKRRKETLAWFTGEMERDEMEVALRPSQDKRSGVLQFHIHQCHELELESLGGTYSSSLNRRKAAAGGKPALSDVVDRTSAENPDPPSAYVEVLLNDRLVYRTRTKQFTPLPYFNAVSERFIRDWTRAKIVFVVRDERDREHDPILGIVSIPLREAFTNGCQTTRWYPIVGGLGWGRIRLSLLWKPVDIDLPPRVSGYEVSTLEIKSLAATNLVGNSERGMALSLETDTDRFTLYSGDAYDNGKSTITLEDAQADFPQTPSAFDDLAELTEVEWDIQRPIRLAVEYRHSCSVLLSFVVRTGVLKKKKVLALGSVRLTDCADNEECTRTVPIFGTSSVKDAVHAAQLFERMQQQQQEQQPLKSDRPLSAATLSSIGSAQSAPSTPSRVSGAVQQTRLVGFASIRFAVRPGVSRAHKRLAKKDMRFKHVYEAWEAEREVKIGLDKMGMRDAVRKEKEGVMKRESALAKKGRSGEATGTVGGVDNGENGKEEVDSESESETSSEESDEDGQAQGRPRGSASASGKSLVSPGEGTKAVGGDGSESAEEDLGVEGFGSERRAHAHALHKRHKGIFQLKIARTGRFVKDKIEAKMWARSNERRARGADLEVEKEGQSRL